MSDSYIEGLRYELAGAVQLGDKDHEKAVRAELARFEPPVKREKAVAAKATETRKKG